MLQLNAKQVIWAKKLSASAWQKFKWIAILLHKRHSLLLHYNSLISGYDIFKTIW